MVHKKEQLDVRLKERMWTTEHHRKDVLSTPQPHNAPAFWGSCAINWQIFIWVHTTLGQLISKPGRLYRIFLYGRLSWAFSCWATGHKWVFYDINEEHFKKNTGLSCLPGESSLFFQIQFHEFLINKSWMWSDSSFCHVLFGHVWLPT